MPDDLGLALRVRDELRAALEAFARSEADRPGAMVLINVLSPLRPGADLQQRLQTDAGEVLKNVGRAWTPSLHLSSASRVSVDVGFATAILPQSPLAVPHISLEFPEDQTSQGLVRSQLEDSVVYSLMREAFSAPDDGSHALLLGSQHFPADPFLQLRRDGDKVSVRAPHPEYKVRLLSPSDALSDKPDPLQLHGDWQTLVSEALPTRASGCFEVVREESGSPMSLDYNILGWGLQWNNGRQTRFPGVTSHEVIVTKREATIAGQRKPSFIKTYECYTVDEAARLEEHFCNQQEVIRVVNREAGAVVLEELEVWRGAPIRGTGTVTYYGVIPATQTAAVAAMEPHLQPDHRVFVSRPSLPPPDWADGGLASLDDLSPLAHALDIAHRQGAAHCDVKPENLRIRQQYEGPDAAVARTWAVLVDSEAFTQPNGRVRYTGLHTPPYTHPSFDPAALTAARLEQLVANDRLGFVAIAITTLFSPRVCGQVFADPQPSPGWRREVLTEAVADQLPQVPSEILVDLLMAPLEADSSKLAESTVSWSCRDWLTRVTDATARREMRAVSVPDYPPRVAEVLKQIRVAFQRAASPNREEAVASELEHQIGLVFWRSLMRGILIGTAAAVVFALILVVVITQGGAV